MMNYYNPYAMPSQVALMNLAEEQNMMQQLNAFRGVEDKLENLKSNAGHLLSGIENLAMDDQKGQSLGLELTENAMILPLIDGHGQTQLVVIDRSTELAKEVLTSYFENGTVPVLAPPVLPVEPVIEPIVAPIPEPLPIVAPVPEVVVPAPVPVVAPVAPVVVPPPIVPIDLEAKKTELPADLANEVLLGLDKIKANSVNLAAQLKNTIELHAHDVAQPMLAGLFDIARETSKLSNHMKDIKQTQLNQATLL